MSKTTFRQISAPLLFLGLILVLLLTVVFFRNHLQTKETIPEDRPLESSSPLKESASPLKIVEENNF